MPFPSLPSDPRRRTILFVAGAVLLVVLGLATLRIRAERSEVRELQALGDSLEVLRVAFDSCRFDLGRDETAFRAFDVRVDSLREAVRDFEALDERGVPAEEYDAYLTTFDRYNQSVEAWEARADSLRSQSARCRTLAERHNVVADSLRVRMEAREEG